MHLEFHQLDLRWEHLRVREPHRQRQLLASLAESGQQTPIVVVSKEGNADYLVIEGYKRIAALKQLGRDTVEATVWPMGEAEALLLSRAQRMSPRESALEQGWLLSEMEQRFSYSLDELARRFDRSISWVSRRLALVELLPEAVQRHVREGNIAAQIAMKYLVPVARVSAEDCERMANVFVKHRCDARQAAQLYTAWREGSRVVRARILTEPELFLKTQRQPPTAKAAAAEQVERDLEMALAILRRAGRKLNEALPEMNAASYQALTAFCRRQGIGQTPVVPAGQYHFEPGVEMQHDTSPHEVEVGGRKYKAQTASAVLCYSRMLFFQINPTFQRFDCKVFLTDAVRYMNGAPERVMIDNTHVVVLRGTGREMIPVPEMEAFADRLGFRFVAHERGDANRSARVERPFSFIENNFLAGRTFTGWQDLNLQARQWCDKVNSTYKKHLRAVPRELFAVERLHLKPLPAWVPEVYRLHRRTADTEGYVSVNSIRYSVPVSWIGRSVEVRETRDRIEIELDPRHIVVHDRVLTPPNQRIMRAEHRPPRGAGVKRNDPHPEEQALLESAPEIAPYLSALKQKGRKGITLALRQMLRLLREYPREPFLAAVAEAARYGLYDLDRLERMILRRVARDYFLIGEKAEVPIKGTGQEAEGND